MRNRPQQQTLPGGPGRPQHRTILRAEDTATCDKGYSACTDCTGGVRDYEIILPALPEKDLRYRETASQNELFSFHLLPPRPSEDPADLQGPCPQAALHGERGKGVTIVFCNVFGYEGKRAAPLHGKLEICLSGNFHRKFPCHPRLLAGVFPLRPFTPQDERTRGCMTHLPDLTPAGITCRGLYRRPEEKRGFVVSIYH